METLHGRKIGSALAFVLCIVLLGFLFTILSHSTYTHSLQLEVRSALLFGGLSAQFSAQAQEHMQDVHRLFLIGLGILVLLFVILWKNHAYVEYTFVLWWFAAIFVLSLFLQAHFTVAFEIFHKIFFWNDLWLFPSSDLLVQLFSEDFFFSAFVNSIIRAAAIGILYFVLTQTKQKRLTVKE